LSESGLDEIFAIVKRNPGLRPLILEFVLPSGKFLEMLTGEEFYVGDERAIREAAAPFLLAS
jgi:hypothetical protein